MTLSFDDGCDHLAPGTHRATVEDVETSLVDAFSGSRTRRPIFDEWIVLRGELHGLGFLGKQWVDGSFATRKLDPNDVDVATFLDGPGIDGAKPETQDQVNALFGGSDTDRFPRCDSFAIVEYPDGHPLHEVYVTTRDSFATVFYGYDDRLDIAKGFAEVLP